MEKFETKTFKDKKEKKAYITWEDNDMDSSSDSENEIVNLSLMAKDYESEEEVASSNYDLSIFFYELQDSFSKKTISN